MGFTIIAHRGDSDNAPENTVAAFDMALQHGFQHFETDAQLSADGHVVLLHGEQLGRTNNGVGPTCQLTLAELQALDAGSWFSSQGPQAAATTDSNSTGASTSPSADGCGSVGRQSHGGNGGCSSSGSGSNSGSGKGLYSGERIPALAAVLERYKGRAHIHLELKSQQLELPAAVARELRAAGWDSIAADGGPWVSPGLTITSFHPQQLAACKKLLPAVRHALLIQEVTPEAVAEALQAGAECVCPRANALTPEGVGMLRAEKLEVRAWGVRTVELLKHVVACGAGGATVNWPRRARDVLQQRQQTQQQ